MASRASLNKVLLIGNLTRDPELRYTPSGAAVCSFGVATNRVYTSSDGQKKEEVEFSKIVSWGKLAELCSQLLTKGRKVYVEGRLQTRSWETPDGQNRQTTEVVIDDMRILDSRPGYGVGTAEGAAGSPAEEVLDAEDAEEKAPADGGEKVSAEAGGAEDKPKRAVKAAKNEDPPAHSGSEPSGSKTGGEPKTNEEDQKVDLDDLPF
ncbi:MAG: single-stranded DNA-binding protein [Candidatus Curtissbacteria bacterium]|nr:single-stranded DNA-binding protein [Candidatus Curtissbacteria bacterium]